MRWCDFALSFKDLLNKPAEPPGAWLVMKPWGDQAMGLLNRWSHLRRRFCFFVTNPSGLVQGGRALSSTPIVAAGCTPSDQVKIDPVLHCLSHMDQQMPPFPPCIFFYWEVTYIWKRAWNIYVSMKILINYKYNYKYSYINHLSKEIEHSQCLRGPWVSLPEASTI